MDVDSSRPVSYPHHNDHGSKFSFIHVWFCSKFIFALLYTTECTNTSLLCLVFCVCFGTKFSVLRLLSHKGVSQVLPFGFPIINW